MAEDPGASDREPSAELNYRQRRVLELQERAKERSEPSTVLRPGRTEPGVVFISMPKREYGNVKDAWQQLMWILNTAKGEKISMLADFRSGYDRAISYIISQARTVPRLEMFMMLDGDVQPEIDLREGVAIARQAFELGYGGVASPVPSSSLRVMVQPIGEKSKTEPYDVSYCAITNWGFISAPALMSLTAIGEWGDVEDKVWPAFIEEGIRNGTGDTHLCKRLGELGWKLRADPRLFANHRKDARIQSDRLRTKIEVS
jgi:hypothetical protein